MSHSIKGKALLIVDAGVDDKGARTYSTEACIQTASGLQPESLSMAEEEFAMLDGHVFDVPAQCRKMKLGDRWRIAVAYEIFYVKAYDHYSGGYEWDVQVEFTTAKTLKKQPWHSKRHERYVAKAKR